MANEKISALTNASALDGTEEWHATQDGNSRAASAAQVSEYVARLMHPGYIPGRWYPALETVAGTTLAVATNVIRMYPFRVYHPITITHLGVNVTTLSAGTNIGLAIYAHDPRTGNATGNPLANAAVSCAATGSASATIAQTSVTLQPGIYWMAFIGSSGAFNVAGSGAAQSYLGAFLGGGANPTTCCPSSSSANYRHEYSGTYGTWPDLTGGSPSIGNVNGNMAFAAFLAA